MIRIARAFGLFDRLAVRLAALLSVALLPLGILAMASSYQSLRTDQRSAERSLLSLTADTEGGRRALVESALTTARVLGQPVLERLDDPVACRTLLSDTVRQSGVFSFAGFIETNGAMRCLSSGEAMDLSGHGVFERLLAEPNALVRRAETGVSGGQPVLIVTLPIRDDLSLRGFLSITISLDSFVWMRWDNTRDGAVTPVLFNRFGDILSSGATETPEALLPEGRSLAELARSGAGTVFGGRTGSDARAVFAVSELVPGQLYVLGVWDPRAPEAAAIVADRWPLLLPLVMWLASIGVVFFALYFLVIRHLREMAGQMRRFALGDRTLPPRFPPNVSAELRDVHATFCKMAMLVTRDEGKLSDALAEKEASLRERTVLLKEVHHRVKNNLQLIASILNLQMRRLRDPRSKAVLRNVQDRVIGLATIHRNLYQSKHISELRADHLIEELLRHLFAIGTETGRRIDVQTDLDRVTLQADQLVPLSLLLTEAVTNALKYVGKGAGDARPWIRVEMKAEDEMVTLVVSNGLGPETDAARAAEDPDNSGLGSELIDAFAAQLGGDLRQGPGEAAGADHWALRLTFRIGTETPTEEAPDQPAADLAADPAERPAPVAS